jgi:hypothetical protein
MAGLPQFIACSCAQRLFPELRAAIDEDAEHGTMVPVAGILFELDPNLARRTRHERCHDDQASRYAPSWAPQWFPKVVLAFLGRAEFWRDYQSRHEQLGYFGNPLEIEARRAEVLGPPLSDSDGELTPVNP